MQINLIMPKGLCFDPCLSYLITQKGNVNLHEKKCRMHSKYCKSLDICLIFISKKARTLNTSNCHIKLKMQGFLGSLSYSDKLLLNILNWQCNQVMQKKFFLKNRK